jgi:hypothetical protein
MKRHRRPRTKKCQLCGKPTKVALKGRVPTYCGQGCKQQAYETRRHRGPRLALIEDIASAKLQGMFQSELRNFLLQAGFIDGMEIAPATSTARKPKLNLILNENPIPSKASERAGQPFDPKKI